MEKDKTKLFKYNIKNKIITDDMLIDCLRTFDDRIFHYNAMSNHCPEHQSIGRERKNEFIPYRNSILFYFKPNAVVYVQYQNTEYYDRYLRYTIKGHNFYREATPHKKYNLPNIYLRDLDVEILPEGEYLSVIMAKQIVDVIRRKKHTPEEECNIR